MANIKKIEFGPPPTHRIPKPGENANPEKKHSFEPPEKKESNKMIFFLIAVLLVFIVAGVGLLVFLFLGKVTPPTPPVSNITNITGNATNITISEGCDDQCMLLLAQNTESATYCEMINDSSLISQCHLVLANISLTSCLKGTGQGLLDCVTYHAKKNSDIGICSNLLDIYKSSCMAAVDPCNAMNGTQRTLCLALSKKDYTICSGDESCILNFSLTTGNAAACDGIADTVKRYACASGALKKDKCYDLALQAQKDLCYQLYAIYTDDQVTCTAITQDSIYALDCFSFFAINRSQYSICDRLTLNNRWACYSNYSLGVRNTSGCVAIDKLAYTARFRCFYDFAMRYGDPSACDLIGDPSQTLTCYVGSIMSNTTLDYTNCAGVAREEWKNKCYSVSAKMKNDSSICGYIQTINESNNCKSQFS